MNAKVDASPAPQSLASLSLRVLRSSLAEILLLALAPFALIWIGHLASGKLALFGGNLDLLDFLFSPPLKSLLPDLVADELAAAYWAGVFPLLIFTRIRPLPRVAVLSVAVVWIIGLFYFFHSRSSAQALRDIQSNTPQDIRPDPWILVPVFLVPIRSLARLILPFVAGIMLAGRDFSLRKFALGCFIPALLIDAIYNGRFPLTPAPLVGSALLTSFACLPLMLPRQREALGRLFGRSLGGGVVGAAAPEPTLAFRAVSMAVITALVLILPIGGVIGYVERQISSVINKGARPPHRSPALVNAHDEMKTLFTKGTSKNISENEAPENTILGYPNTIPNSFAGCVLPAFYTPEVGEMAIRKTPPEALTAYFKFLAPYIETIEKVKESDYCDFSGGSIPNFINLRATSRALAFRSIVRLSEGKPEDAARDIDTVFRLGTVLQTDGTIVQYMVGTAIVGIGTQAAYEYFLWNRNQPEKLAILIRAMERSAPRIHQSFDFERIRRTEPGWWPIALYPELSVPGYFRAHDGYYCKWLEFDFVLVAMKLELYRNANGAYPDSLGQLVPEYLDRVPLDPSDGKPWIYKNLGTEFELSSAMNEQLGADRGFPKQFKLPFPVSEVDTPEARETIEKWIPGAPVEKNPKIPQAKGKKAK